MTVLNESFNTANSDTLGPDLTWNELDVDIDIVSNHAQSVGTGSFLARAEHDLATLNQYAQAIVDISEDAAAGDGGVIVRKDATATLTFYQGRANYFVNEMQLYRIVAGVAELLGSAAKTLTPGTPVLVRVEANESNIRLLADGVEVVNVIDAAPITAGLRTGIRAGKSTSGFVSWDDFEAGDIIEGVGEVMITGISSVGSVNGRLKASQLNAISLPTGIPNVFADGSGNLCVTATPVGVGFSTGYPGVRANADGRLRIATTPVGTLKPSGIPNVDADSNGSIHVEITTTDLSDLPTGIPGVQASADRRLRVILEN